MPPGDLITAARSATGAYTSVQVSEILCEPLILLSAPRSGSTLLFEQLRAKPGLWSIGGESHGIFRAFPGLRAENEQLDSGCLGAAHADPETADAFRRCFLLLARDHVGEPWLGFPPGERPASLRLIEKTPRNALNVPFLRQVFPDARFVYLYRDARSTIASMVEAWSLGLETGRFVTFTDLPGWDRSAWCFLLPPGWRELRGSSLFEIAAFQWAESNRRLLADLGNLGADRCAAVGFDDLVEHPAATIERLSRLAGIDVSPGPAGPLPLSRTTVSPPQEGKWRRWQSEIEALADRLADVERDIGRAALRWQA